jgi:hypothetical protein
MNEFWSHLIYEVVLGGAVGAVVATVVVLPLMLGLAYLFPKNCPECAAPLPKLRVPTSVRQAFWGGWTCPVCGCEVDRRGKKIDPGARK